MEKLIELLNEYIEEEELGNTVKEIDDDYFVNNYNNWDGYLCEKVMSKKFGFIKWLVDNDKIDYEEYADEWRDSNVADNADFFNLSMRYNVYESLLMVLAIQDNPIEFLIMILK